GKPARQMDQSSFGTDVLGLAFGDYVRAVFCVPFSPDFYRGHIARSGSSVRSCTAGHNFVLLVRQPLRSTAYDIRKRPIRREILGNYFGVRRQSEAATALYVRQTSVCRSIG